MTDPAIREECDINSVWKVAELALRCKEREVRTGQQWKRWWRGLARACS
jgi:hypothetical protein